ncbi:MAG: tRNA lysidine(34) synthetase TilS, partial [Spirochaetaceae bacterium]|nr:tRNA lysidine(34) synthetase TilS [Spirochaetaceae bacterium]
MDTQAFEAAVLAGLDGVSYGDIILAAVSGGADSTALLAALFSLQPKFSYKLNVLHVNHNLRGEESARDAAAVEMLCKQFSLPCRIETIPEGNIICYAKEAGCGIEAAARHVRHTALLNEATRLGACTVATAHTKTDLLETFIMRLLRGS